MWTLDGPFDVEIGSDTKTASTKVKLIKPGCDYMLGRKERPLVISHKKISRDHLIFQVGEYTEEDAENPEKRPILKLQNVGSANRKYQRGPDELTVDRGASVELEDGDVVKILHNIPVTVKWEQVVCYSPPEQTRTGSNARDCAKLGLSLVLRPYPEVTHHLTSTYSLTAAIATSLVAKAHVVKPEWLEALLLLGTSSDGPSALESEFALPPVSKFRPGFSSSLPSSLKNHRSWEMNDDRTDMLSNFRFIFVGERGREAREDIRELVRRGGATYECCPAQGGRKALHDVLAKSESKGKQPVLMADETAMLAALGQDGWSELVEEAAIYELRFIRAEKLTQAVVHIDRTYLDCSTAKPATENQSTPDVILNTNPDEPSVPPATIDLNLQPPVPETGPSRRKLIRRTGNRAASRASSPSRAESQTQAEGSSSNIAGTSAPAEEPEEEHAPPRRKLVRRFERGKTPIVGIDDPSTLDGESADASNREASKEPDEPAPASTQKRSRLKRRFGPNAQQAPSQPAAFYSYTPVVDEEEPPLKKYRALFEQTAPEKIAQSSMEEYMTMMKDTGGQNQNPDQEMSDAGQSQAQAQAERTPLAAVPEEEEESTQTQMRDRSNALKRKIPDNNEIVEVEDTEETSRTAKRRAVENVNAVQPSQPAHASQPPAKPVSKPASKPISKTASKPISSKTQAGKSQTHAASGASPGKPDTDEAFLKAVASTKRGKKHEDDFDREFNNLKISKPDLQLQQEEAAKEWAVLEEFGDDGDLRGNFMVVVEIDVFKKDDTPRDALRVTGSRLDWEGRPNFKKFKQKAVGERRKPVELVIDDDYYAMDIDYDYLKDSHTQSHNRPASEVETAQRSRPRSQTQRNPSAFIDSDDELALPKVTQGKTQRRAQPRAPSPSVEPEPKPTKKTRTNSKANNMATTRGKAAQPLFFDSEDEDDAYEDKARDDDDESDEFTLPTTGRRTQDAKPNARKRTAVMDDDSDDAFRGFSNKRARR